MKHESAVDFATESRIHMALAVRNLEQSLAFYRVLFGQEPTKTRPHYAKFEVAEPPVNLALNEVAEHVAPNHAVAHFGVQLKATCSVAAIAKRLEEAGYATISEEHVTCCYAVQNKIWATDPDGNRWEVYVLLDDNGEFYHPGEASTCCPDMPETRSSLMGLSVLEESAPKASSCCSVK